MQRHNNSISIRRHSTRSRPPNNNGSILRRPDILPLRNTPTTAMSIIPSNPRRVSREFLQIMIVFQPMSIDFLVWIDNE
jgi:hypothetical protein